MKTKLAVGYQKRDSGELFSDMVLPYLNEIGEIYFSWNMTPSGRSITPLTDWEAQAQMEYELHRLRAAGLRLDLLFNANCYGEEAISTHLEKEYCNLIDYLGTQELFPEIATTASLFLAKVLKRNFPEIECRASVNMRLDSTLALECIADLFDSFYLRRDLQRDLDTVRLFRRWSDSNGKKMGILANSGCLRNCPAQTFHDNLVAHQQAVYKLQFDPASAQTLCWKHYQSRKHRVDFLKSSWIRPEDLGSYDDLTDFIKLAIRQHDRPDLVIAAYAERSYEGDLAALMEPNFSTLFAEDGILENQRLPSLKDLPGACAANCHHCGKCDALFEKVYYRKNITAVP